MNSNPMRQFVRLILLAATALGLTGCLLPDFDGGHGSRGVALSDAMKASASGGGKISGGHSTSYRSGPDIDVFVSGESSGSASSGDTSEAHDGFMIIEGTQIIPFHGDIKGITRFGITGFTVEDELNQFGFYLGGGDVEFRENSLPDLATENSWMYDMGLTYRRYLTEPHTFINPYIAAGVFYQFIAWQYRTPITIGGDTIRGDSLMGGGGCIGLGLTVARQNRLSVFGEVKVGATVFQVETAEGFHNDVIENYTFISVMAGVSIRF